MFSPILYSQKAQIHRTVEETPDVATSDTSDDDVITPGQSKDLIYEIIWPVDSLK